MRVKEVVTTHWHISRELRRLRIDFEPARCIGCWQCYEVCPVGRWAPDCDTRVAIFTGQDQCVACGACVLQCPEQAIRLTA